MSETVTIIEVGPRDGLQSEPTILETETKIELVKRALNCGIKSVEVASFVNPKKVPQMADAEKVLENLPRSADSNYIGLVFNHRGFERARDAGVDEIGFVVVASETFNKKNQGTSIAESIDIWSDIAKQAQNSGMRASIMISAAFGCPFEGEIDESTIAFIAERVLKAGPDQLALADSIGAGAPGQVKSLVKLVKSIDPDTPVRCHFHNTRNTGLANAFAAFESGAVALDSSIGGMGGCPFAPAATGNIPTEDLVYMLERSGVNTGISLPELIETSLWLQEQLGHDLPGMLPKAGLFPKTSH